MQFNFSTASISIREDEDLPSRLSIVKTGLIEPNITFQVYVYPGEGSPNENGKVATIKGKVLECSYVNVNPNLNS